MIIQLIVQLFDCSDVRTHCLVELTLDSKVQVEEYDDWSMKCIQYISRNNDYDHDDDDSIL